MYNYEITHHNFGAGPCILHPTVFNQAAKSIIDFNGLSILEISHRSKEFVKVMSEAIHNVKHLLNVPDEYDVLFLQGGASLGFLISAMNTQGKHKKGGYVDTGSWANKAYKEACKIGKAVLVASSKDRSYTYVPKEYNIPSDIDYLHITSNNTIYGTQLQSFPEVKIPLIADMSSDIFSKPINVSKFDMIYAGAQKNLGPAGTTLYIVKKQLLENVSSEIPSMLNLKVHRDKESMFNTPPVFSVYVSLLNLNWMIEEGGVKEMEKRNSIKSSTLYTEIDRNSLFEGVVDISDRSKMNVTFTLKNATLEDTFLKLCTKHNIIGIKGHRSVGGFRASMYNALSIDSVNILVEVMKEFEKSYGKD